MRTSRNPLCGITGLTASVARKEKKDPELFDEFADGGCQATDKLQM
jgi:hypothetical protein